MKVMNTAYEPLPPVFSRPFQQLINYLLRADPDDRPTTQVRTHAASVPGPTSSVLAQRSVCPGSWCDIGGWPGGVKGCILQCGRPYLPSLEEQQRWLEDRQSLCTQCKKMVLEWLVLLAAECPQSALPGPPALPHYLPAPKQQNQKTHSARHGPHHPMQNRPPHALVSPAILHVCACMPARRRFCSWHTCASI